MKVLEVLYNFLLCIVLCIIFMAFLSMVVYAASNGFDSVYNTCEKTALESGFPKYRYMNGICFGINDKKAKMLYKLGQK